MFYSGYLLLFGPSFAEPHARGRNFDSHRSLRATFRKERMQDASAPGAYLKHSFNCRELSAQKAHILRIGSLFHRADIPPALCGGFIILRSLYVFIGFVCEILFHSCVISAIARDQPALPSLSQARAVPRPPPAVKDPVRAPVPR